MNSKCLLILCLALFQIASSRPRNGISGSEPELPEPEVKVREKRKYEGSLWKRLEESGVGAKKNAGEDEQGRSGAKTEKAESGKGSEKGEESPRPEIPAAVDQETGNRVKKQSPNNVGRCGKTACGPVVSARGASADDINVMLRGDYVPVADLLYPRPGKVVDASSKAEQFSPVQGRTFDLMGMGMAPVSVAGYGAPAVYAAAPAAAALPADNTYGHSFFKPQTFPAMPAVVISHQPAHSLVHPMLLPHLMPHLVPGIGSFFAPHRLEPARLPEAVPADLKQPVPAYPPPSYVGADSTLVCTPYRNQRLDIPYDYIYKPDSAIDKSLNVTDSGKKSHGGSSSAEEERRIQEHLKKVNEIKEEITQLNRAAQRIVDQQERMTQMQQKQLWGTSGSTSASQAAASPAGPYMGAGYYAYPSMPWGYSKSNILSYPNSHDDIDFFLNLLRAGKKIGLISDSFQPSVLSTMGEALKGMQGGVSSPQKDAANADSVSGDKAADKKSRR